MRWCWTCDFSCSCYNHSNPGSVEVYPLLIHLFQTKKCRKPSKRTQTYHRKETVYWKVSLIQYTVAHVQYVRFIMIFMNEWGVFVGWSSSSSQLTSKLHLLRLKADMAITLEKRTKDCTASLDTYQQHLTAPLPHSVALHKCQLQWKEKEVCEKTVYTLGRLLCACLLAYMYSTCVNAATCVYTVLCTCMFVWACLTVYV